MPSLSATLVTGSLPCSSISMWGSVGDAAGTDDVQSHSRSHRTVQVTSGEGMEHGPKKWKDVFRKLPTLATNSSLA